MSWQWRQKPTATPMIVSGNAQTDGWESSYTSLHPHLEQAGLDSSAGQQSRKHDDQTHPAATAPATLRMTACCVRAHETCCPSPSRRRSPSHGSPQARVCRFCLSFVPVTQPRHPLRVTPSGSLLIISPPRPTSYAPHTSVLILADEDGLLRCLRFRDRYGLLQSTPSDTVLSPPLHSTSPTSPMLI